MRPVREGLSSALTELFMLSESDDYLDKEDVLEARTRVRMGAISGFPYFPRKKKGE